MAKTDDPIDFSTLEDRSPQTIADQCSTPVVWSDHQVTRRQRIHGCSIPGRADAYTSTHINEIIDYLDEQGFNQAIFICQTPRGQHLACFIEFQALASPIDPEALQTRKTKNTI